MGASKLARGGAVTRCQDPRRDSSTDTSRTVVAAQQESERSHVTASASPEVPGIDWTRQPRAFHCSLHGRAALDDVAASALTAQQSFAVAQLIPANSDPAGLGEETTRHA